MNLRREQIYITTDLLHSLWQIARLRSGQLDDQGFPHTINPDEIAVQLLRGAIKEHYPWLDDLQKAQAKLEDDAMRLAQGKDKKAQ